VENMCSTCKHSNWNMRDSWSAKSGPVLGPTPTLARPVRRGRKGIGETVVRLVTKAD